MARRHRNRHRDQHGGLVARLLRTVGSVVAPRSVRLVLVVVGLVGCVVAWRQFNALGLVVWLVFCAVVWFVLLVGSVRS